MAFDPFSLGLGIAQFGVSTILGNNAAASSKKNADKQAQKNQKANKDQWRIDTRNTNRAVDVAIRNQEIDYRNLEANLKFQEEERQQQYDHGMAIQDYRYTQEQRAYDLSVNRAAQQKDLNQLAEEQAMLEQDRYLQENLQNIAFQEQQTLMDFAVATSGLELKRSQAQASADLAQEQLIGTAELQTRTITEKAALSKERGEAEAKTALSQTAAEAGLAKERIQSESSLALGQLGAQAEFGRQRGAAEAELAKKRISSESELSIKQARSQTLLARQRNTLEALKASGSARALGQAGRSARKVQQGIAAEAGAADAAVTAQYLLAKEATLRKQFFDVLGIDQQLMLNNMDISQRELFQKQSIQQQALFDTAGISQKQKFETENIQQKLYFDSKTLDQAVGLETLAINQKLQYDQQNVVQQLLFTDQAVELDLESLNGQLEFDKLQMQASRDNLKARDAFSRKNIELQRKQADLNAEAKVRLEPEKLPPLPEPLALPRPEKREIFRPEAAAEPVKGNVYIPNNQAATIANSIGVLANTALESGVFDGLFDGLFGGGNTPTPTPGSFTFPSNEALGISDPYSLSNV